MVMGQTSHRRKPRMAMYAAQSKTLRLMPINRSYLTINLGL